jgi:hypothetical protein
MELQEIEEGLLDDSSIVVNVNKKVWWPVGITFPIILLFLMLWLAESQYSQGVLRTKNVGEECGVRLFGDLKCSTGLSCKYGKCIIPTGPECSKNITYIFLNRTEPCEKCPKVQPKIVTYFDFDEGPNRWLNPGPHGFYEYIRHIPYGGCKEICSSRKKCKAISYQGPSESCHLMQEFYFPAPVNDSWNYAIKII